MLLFRLAEVSIPSARAPFGVRCWSSLSFISRFFGAHIIPPKPKKVPSFQTVHGVELRDDFSWLKNRGSRDVRRYIKGENRYAAAIMKDTEGFQEKLTNEMNDWMDKHVDDESVPEELDGYIYYLSNPPENFFLPIYCRRKIMEDGSFGAQEVILNQNELKERYNHVSIPTIKMSPSRKYMGFLLDRKGDGSHSCYITEACEGAMNTIDVIPNTVNFEWGPDDRTIFYTRPDNLQRPFALLRHKTCQSVLSDVVLHEEKDERFVVDVSATRDRKYITINCNSRSTSEVSIVDIRDGLFKCKPLNPREKGLEYYVDHRDDLFYIITNADGGNYRVMTAPEGDPWIHNWQTFIPDKPEIFLDDMDLFKDYCVIYERQKTIPQIRIVPLAEPDNQYVVKLPEDACVLDPGSNQMFESSTVRFTVSSPILPACVIEYNMETKTMVEKHNFSKKPSFDSSEFCCTRHEIQSKDGTFIPITLFHHKNLHKDGKNPLLLHVYGSYGINVDMGFNVEQVSLLKRGWCLAFCHVRGGGEVGREWYLQGKMENKHKGFEALIMKLKRDANVSLRTFYLSDFEACARALHRMGYANPQLTVARGTSAGGLIVGAVCNRSPELFKAVILKVPFLDILTSMLDPSLPLTVQEYEEWGDPGSCRKAFEYIKSYCPYQNIKDQSYPAVMVNVSMSDDRVPYWLPLKWVARLRDELSKQNDTPLVVCNVDYYGGHFGSQAMYRRFEQAAREYAFLFKALGLPLK